MKNYVNSAKYPIRFERLHPGSLFRIKSEPSRGIRQVEDETVYRRAKDHEGFYAVNVETGAAIILYPQDMVQPIKEVRGGK